MGLMMVVITVAVSSRRFGGGNEGPPIIAPTQVNLNRATRQELALLPGIGAKMADRIVVDRQQNGLFDSIHHLTRVRGIGERTLADITPYCVVEATSHDSP